MRFLPAPAVLPDAAGTVEVTAGADQECGYLFAVLVDCAVKKGLLAIGTGTPAVRVPAMSANKLDSMPILLINQI